MTEAEWIACTADDTGDMQECLRRVESRRKLRLFACACCRHIDDSLTDARSQRALEVAEQYVEGLVSEEDLEAAWRQADRAADEIDQLLGEAEGEPSEQPYHAALAPHWAIIPSKSMWDTIDAVCHAVCHTAFYSQRASNPDSERRWQAVVLCDIFGGQDHLPPFDPSWLTSTVVALARGIYDERAFDRLPILADALEDAGCEHPDILAHCRSDGPHVRGCWVVDLLLGKS